MYKRQVYTYLEALDEDVFQMYDHIGHALARILKQPFSYTERLGPFWTGVTYCFQEWFLGDDLFPKVWGVDCIQTGKSGLMFAEQPIVDKDRLMTLFRPVSYTHRDVYKRQASGSYSPAATTICAVSRFGGSVAIISQPEKIRHTPTTNTKFFILYYFSFLFLHHYTMFLEIIQHIRILYI